MINHEIAQTERPIYGLHLERSMSGGLDVPMTIHTDSILSLLMDTLSFPGKVQILARVVDEEQTPESILSDELVNALTLWRGHDRNTMFEYIKAEKNIDYDELHFGVEDGMRPFRTEWLDLTQIAQDYLAGEYPVKEMLPRIGGASTLLFEITGDNPERFLQTVQRNIFDRQFGSKTSAIDDVMRNVCELTNTLHYEYNPSDNIFTT
jgi:hypothetical protein